MGAFRSLKARKANTETLTHEDVPKLLAEGEWVKYLTVLPHRVAVRIADEAAMPVLGGRRGNTVTGIKIRSGTMGQIKLEEGILDWNLLDEDGNEVAWDADRAAVLVEGLEPALRRELLARIDSATPTGLGDQPDGDDDPANEKDTEGNASGES